MLGCASTLGSISISATLKAHGSAGATRTPTACASVLSKGTDLSQHGAGELSAVAHALNSRPRKTLGWRTPAEALDGLLKSDMIEGVAATG